MGETLTRTRSIGRRKPGLKPSKFLCDVFTRLKAGAPSVIQLFIVLTTHTELIGMNRDPSLDFARGQDDSFRIVFGLS